MVQPVVSVIIPNCNNESFLKDSVDSVLNQIFQNFEIIIIDNNLTNQPKNIVNTDKRIHYFCHENNSLNSVKNNGIKNAKGKYIIFLDSGNIFKPENLEKQVTVLNKNPDIGLVYSGISFIDENKNHIGNKPVITYKGDVFNKLVVYNFLYNGSAVLFRKNCLEKTGLFDESINKMGDWEFYLRFSSCYKFWGIGEHLVKHRMLEKTVSNDFELFENSGFKVLNKVFQINNLNVKYLRRINLAYAMRYTYMGKKYLQNNLYKKAKGYFSSLFQE